jgi:ATP-dependent Clp protease ATP-binding subunit ClpA
MLKRLNKRLAEGRGIQLAVTTELAERIAKLGYHPEFGARPMNRLIQDKIESKIAKKILAGELERGDVIEIGPEELGG